MRSCVQSNNERAVVVQNAQMEHNLVMDKMITQVSQLAYSINALKVNAGRFHSKEYALDSGETPVKSEGSCKEPEVRILSDDSEGEEIVESALAQKSFVHEVKMIIASQHDKAPRIDLKKLMSGGTRENPKQGVNVLGAPDTQQGTLSPVTDEQEECNRKGRYNRGSERSGKRAAGKVGSRKRERWT